jgi:hypothetical protein
MAVMLTDLECALRHGGSVLSTEIQDVTMAWPAPPNRAYANLELQGKLVCADIRMCRERGYRRTLMRDLKKARVIDFNHVAVEVGDNAGLFMVAYKVSA